MSQYRHKFIIDLTGNLDRKSRQWSRDMEQFGNRTTRSMRAAQQSVRALDSQAMAVARNVHRQVSRVGKVAAVALGAAAVAGIREVGNLEERVKQLGVNANLSGAQLDSWADGFKKKIAEAGTAIGVDGLQIIDGIESIVEKTGDLEFAERNITNIAKAMRATGGQGRSFGGILGELQKIDIKDPDKVMAVLDALAAQGKMGAFTLKDMAQYGEEVFAAYQPQNIDDIREMNAVMQVIRMGKGSSAEAVTAFKAVMRTFTDKDKLSNFDDIVYNDAEGRQQKGIDIYRRDENGKEVMRDITDIFVDLVSASRGDLRNLSDVFDAEAVDAFKALASKQQQGVDIEDMLIKQLEQVDATGMIDRDAAEMGETFNANKKKVTEIVKKNAEEMLRGVVEGMAAFIDSLDTETVDLFIKAIIGATTALAGFGMLSMLPGGKGRGLGRGLGRVLGLGAGAATGATVLSQTTQASAKTAGRSGMLRTMSGQASRIANRGGKAGAAGLIAMTLAEIVAPLYDLAKQNGITETVSNKSDEFALWLGNLMGQDAAQEALRLQQLNSEQQAKINNELPEMASGWNIDAAQFETLAKLAGLGGDTRQLNSEMASLLSVHQSELAQYATRHNLLPFGGADQSLPRLPAHDDQLAQQLVSELQGVQQQIEYAVVKPDPSTDIALNALQQTRSREIEASSQQAATALVKEVNNEKGELTIHVEVSGNQASTVTSVVNAQPSRTNITTGSTVKRLTPNVGGR